MASSVCKSLVNIEPCTCTVMLCVQYFACVYLLFVHYVSLLQRPPGIGLPDTPVMMHDLNLEEMMVPRYTAPLQPTGRLKVQLQFAENSLNVIIIEVSDVRYMRSHNINHYVLKQ